MKYTYFLICFSFVLTACKKEEEKPQETTKEKTFVVFNSYNDANSTCEIYYSNTDGTGFKRISPYSSNGNLDSDYNPIWSPDGKKIVYFSLRENYRPNIYVYNFETQQEHKIGDVSNSSGITSVSWSPNSQKLVFASSLLFPMEDHIFTADWNGQNMQRITPDGLNYSEPHWHPINNEIICFKNQSGFKKIIRLSLETLTENGEYAQNIKNVIFSKDGAKLYFHHIDNNGIGVMDYSFSNLMMLTTDGGDYPSLSPDGSRIAYVIPDNLSPPKYDLAVINASNGSLKITLSESFTNKPEFNSNRYFQPSWTKNNYVISACNLGNIALMKDQLSPLNYISGNLNALDFPQVKPN